jgi:hypothetical protein
MRNSRLKQAYKISWRGGFLMASATCELTAEEKTWSLSPASRLAALIHRLKHGSGRRPETFRERMKGPPFAAASHGAMARLMDERQIPP